jgi:hypothetical protein
MHTFVVNIQVSWYSPSLDFSFNLSVWKILMKFYPLVDSWLNSLQPRHVLCHEFVEKGIITAAFL